MQRDRRGAERHRRIFADRRGNAQLARLVDHRRNADLLRQPHRDDIRRCGKGGGEADLAAIAAIVVLGGVVADLDRVVLDHVTGPHAGIERRQIDEQLERRSRLALRLGGAVEAAWPCNRCRRPCATTRAIEPHRHQRRLADPGRTAIDQRILDGALGLRLQIMVERRLDDDIAIAGFGQRGARLGQHPIGEIAAGRQGLAPRRVAGRARALSASAA